MNIEILAAVLKKSGSKRSIASEILKCIIKNIKSDDMNILLENAIYLNKNSYLIIYDEYSNRLKNMNKEMKNIKIRQVLTYMNEAQTYLHKIRIAKLIITCVNEDIEVPEDVIFELLGNKYYSMRKIAYTCIEENPDIAFMNKLIENYKIYNDEIHYYR